MLSEYEWKRNQYEERYDPKRKVAFLIMSNLKEEGQRIAALVTNTFADIPTARKLIGEFETVERNSKV